MGRGRQEDSLAGIRYMGSAGFTQPCIEAVQMLLSGPEPIRAAQLLSDEPRHGFLFWLDEFRCVAVKQGFGSGSGTGASGLSYVLALLHMHEIEIEQVTVMPDVLWRLNESGLTDADVALVKAQIGTDGPWSQYVFEHHWDGARDRTLWQHARIGIPWGLIEPRIMDLALSFRADADAALMKAYRRLESEVRRRTGLEGQGERLFSAAFLQKNAPLHWPNVSAGAVEGRGTIFTGTFKALRNDRMHEEPLKPERLLHEFMLINELFWLEREAELREPLPSLEAA